MELKFLRQQIKDLENVSIGGLFFLNTKTKTKFELQS